MRSELPRAILIRPTRRPRIRGDGSGLTSFAFALPGTVDPGAEVSATATAETPGQPTDTSELSPCVLVR